MITALHSNYKTPGNRTKKFEFKKINIIFGENGSGKTGILQAIQLAAGTDVCDVQSRDIKAQVRIKEIFAGSSISIICSSGNPGVVSVTADNVSHMPPSVPIIFIDATINKLWAGSSKNLAAKLLTLAEIDPENLVEIYTDADVRKNIRGLYTRGSSPVTIHSQIATAADAEMRKANAEVRSLEQEYNNATSATAGVMQYNLTALQSTIDADKILLADTAKIIGGHKCEACSTVIAGHLNPAWQTIDNRIRANQSTIDSARGAEAAMARNRQICETSPAKIVAAKANAALYQKIKIQATAANEALLAKCATTVEDKLNVLLSFAIKVVPDAEFVIQTARGVALSGTEEAAVLVALGTLLSTPGQQTVVVTPDIGWSSSRLTQYIKQWLTIPDHMQLFIQTTVEPDWSAINSNTVACINLNIESTTSQDAA